MNLGYLADASATLTVPAGSPLNPCQPGQTFVCSGGATDPSSSLCSCKGGGDNTILYLLLAAGAVAAAFASR